MADKVDLNVGMRENPSYCDKAFPVSMHTITKNDIFPKGRGFHDIHWHDEIQFTYVSKGSLKVQVEGKEYHLEEGEAIFVNGGLIHVTTDMSEDGEYVGFMFPEKILGFFAGSRMEQNYVLPYLNNYVLPALLIRKGTEEDEHILSRLTELKEVFGNVGGAAFEYEVSVKLVDIWLQIIKNIEGSVRKVSVSYIRRQERMKKMMQFIIDHYMDAITLNEIAEVANVSVEECRRCFRDTIKETPVHFLLSYRVIMGMELLRNTDLAVTDIAFRVGFNDTSHFIQTFKKKTGMTPKDYRNNIF